MGNTDTVGGIIMAKSIGNLMVYEKKYIDDRHTDKIKLIKKAKSITTKDLEKMGFINIRYKKYDRNLYQPGCYRIYTENNILKEVDKIEYYILFSDKNIFIERYKLYQNYDDKYSKVKERKDWKIKILSIISI